MSLCCHAIYVSNCPSCNFSTVSWLNTEVQQGYPEAKNGTAIKSDNGKPPISLIPAEYIEGTAAVFGFGGKKYGNNNFRKGLAHSRCLDAALRHILAILRGEQLDPESGLPHVFHASASLAMYDYMRLHYPELNDIHEQIKESK